MQGSGAPRRPTIAFGEGRRPEAATHVTLPAFDGPLGLLLALIEARQLDVLTVPLGDLAEAYLDALAALEDDRMGNISSFVAVASQLILIKSRAMLPRRVRAAAGRARRTRSPIPRRSSARGCSSTAPTATPGARLLDEAHARVGLFRREPTAARAAGLAGARPPADGAAARPSVLLVARSTASPGSRRRRSRRPRSCRRTITLDRARRDHPRGAPRRGAGSIVLQDLLRGVRDRVVVAVTFLAMLELMKRREIVVEPGRAVGPDRRPAHDGRGACRGRRPARSTRRRRSTSRWSRSRDDRRPASRGRRTHGRTVDGAPPPAS